MSEHSLLTEKLELLRKPFPENQISKLPKPTRRQTEIVRQDYTKGIRCPLCGGWHHPDVVHLDYVGHAALTDRLLDVDLEWNWSPIGTETPQIDSTGGMWIKLTVCGVTRYGYGSADGKKGGDAIKEVIGDAIRNAAMRFGAALDLWHKGDLHAHHESEEKDDRLSAINQATTNDIYESILSAIEDIDDIEVLNTYGESFTNDDSGFKTLPPYQQSVICENFKLRLFELKEAING